MRQAMSSHTISPAATGRSRGVASRRWYEPEPEVIITQPGSSAPSSIISSRVRRAISRSVWPVRISPAKRRA